MVVVPGQGEGDGRVEKASDQREPEAVVVVVMVRSCILVGQYNSDNAITSKTYGAGGTKSSSCVGPADDEAAAPRKTSSAVLPS